MKIKQLFIKIKSSLKAKKTIKLILASFFGLYVFFIPAFSGRAGFNYIGYFLFAILSVMVFVYIGLFSSFKLSLKHFLMPIFAAYALIGTIFYSHSYREWLTIFLMGVTYFVFVLFFEEIVNKRVLLYICYSAILVFALYFIGVYWKQLIHISNIGTMRLGDYFNNVNAVSNFFAFGFALSLFLSLFCEKKIEIANLISTPIFFVLGVSTGSRTFIIITALIAIILVFLRFKNKKIILLIVLLSIIATGTVLFFMPFMGYVRSRFIDMFRTLFSDGTGESSTIQRTIMQQYAFFLGTKNIFIGLGANGFATFSGYGTYSHSNIFEVFANFGIVGFALFYFLWFYSLSYFKKQKSTLKYFSLAILVAELIHGFFSVLFSSKIAALELAICVSLCSPCSNQFATVFLANTSKQIQNDNYYQIEV